MRLISALAMVVALHFLAVLGCQAQPSQPPSSKTPAPTAGTTTTETPWTQPHAPESLWKYRTCVEQKKCPKLEVPTRLGQPLPYGGLSRCKIVQDAQATGRQALALGPTHFRGVLQELAPPDVY